MATQQPVLFNHLTREQLNEMTPTHIVVIPVAATEQHGPHLPTGTDTFLCETVVHRAASRLDPATPVIVAPTLPYGSSHHHLQFGGTMSITSETYYALLRDLLESLITVGFKRAMLINGHGGNHELVQLAVRDLSLIHPVALAAASYWQMAADAIDETDASSHGRVPGHAGHFETAGIMSIHPDLVVNPLPERDHDPSLIYTPELTRQLRIERKADWGVFNGFTDNPSSATPRRGNHYIQTAASAVAEVITAFDQATR